MKEKNQIDEIFQNRLRDSASEPPAFVWENVERALADKKRRRWAIAFWAVGSLILAGGATAFWLLKTEKGAAQAMISQPLAAIENAPQASLFSNENESEKRIGSVVFSTEKASANASGLSKKTNSFLIEKNGSESQILIEQKLASINAINNKSTENKQINTFFDLTQKREKETDENPFFIKKENWKLEPIDSKNNLFALKNSTSRELPKMKTFRARKRARACPKFGATGSAFLIEAWAGPSFALKELRPVLADAPNYANRRAASERSELSWNAGARAAFLFHRKFIVRAGFQYSQINETFSQRSPYWITIPPNASQTDTIIKYGELVQKTFNRLGFLDLPVTIGAELVGGQFGLTLNGGAAANLLFWKHGELLMPDNRTEKFSNAGIFRANAGLSLIGSAQVFYQINAKTRLFAEPYFQKILRPVTVSSYEIEQRYSTSGVQIGLSRLLK